MKIWITCDADKRASAKNLILVYYPAHIFKALQKPKGDPWKSDFFVEWSLRKRLEGGQEPSKILLHLFKKIKIKNVSGIIDKYPSKLLMQTDAEGNFYILFPILFTDVRNITRVNVYHASRRPEIWWTIFTLYICLRKCVENHGHANVPAFPTPSIRSNFKSHSLKNNEIIFQ